MSPLPPSLSFPLVFPFCFVHKVELVTNTGHNISDPLHGPFPIKSHCYHHYLKSSCQPIPSLSFPFFYGSLSQIHWSCQSFHLPFSLSRGHITQPDQSEYCFLSTVIGSWISMRLKSSQSESSLEILLK